VISKTSIGFCCRAASSYLTVLRMVRIGDHTEPHARRAVAVMNSLPRRRTIASRNGKAVIRSRARRLRKSVRRRDRTCIRPGRDPAYGLSHRMVVMLPERIELSTSPLPRECSTTELRQRRLRRREYTSPCWLAIGPTRRRIRCSAAVGMILAAVPRMGAKGIGVPALDNPAGPRHAFAMTNPGAAKGPAHALKNQRRAQALRDNLRRRKVRANAPAALADHPAASADPAAAAPDLSGAELSPKTPRND
jgi:hypothetical protein